MAQAERYAFIVENFDHHSSMNWRYQFFYYLETKEIEMVRTRENEPSLKCRRLATIAKQLFLTSP